MSKSFLPVHEQSTRSISELTPFDKNSRTHSDAQIEQVCKSIRKFGFTNPVLIDENNTIIAGHCRILAAKMAGIDNIPCVVLHGLSDVEKAAYVIADNKLALNAGWDFDILQEQFEFLKENDFNLELTGFSLEELCDLLPHEEPEIFCNEDDVPEVPVEPITKLGDVWLLGEHRLMCGDSTVIDAVDKLMNGAKADMVFTDPPYGVDVVKSGKVGADFGVAKKGSYMPIIGDSTINTAVDSYSLCVALSVPVLCFWGGNYFASKLLDSSCWIIWDKREDSGIKNTFADCEMAWTNQKKPSRIYRQLWNGMIRKGEHEKRVHPTQKPIALAEWCFDELNPKGKTVLDLFGGSGSTLIACEKLKRKCFMMELDPKYCDVIVKRWENFTGKKAVLDDRT